MPDTAEQVYPPTIGGSADDKATGTSIPLVARRTGETDDNGFEVYEVQVPMPGSWFRAGRVALNFDMVPGRSRFGLQFEAS